MRRGFRRRLTSVAAVAALGLGPVACGDANSTLDCRPFKDKGTSHNVDDQIRIHKGSVFLNGGYTDQDPTLKVRSAPVIPPVESKDFPQCSNIVFELHPGDSYKVEDAEVVSGRNNSGDWLNFEVQLPKGNKGSKRKDVYVSISGTEGYIDGFSSSNIAPFRVEEVDGNGNVTAAREIVEPLTPGRVTVMSRR